MIRNFGTVSGITNQAQGLDIGISTGGGITGIQRGTAILAGSATSVNITISPVDLTRSIVLVQSYNHASSATTSALISIRAVINSATNILLVRNEASASHPVTYTWTVIEFASVKSLQKGQKSLALASDTVTVSSVNTSKSLMFFSYSSTGLMAGGIAPVMGSVTNATTLTFNQLGTTPTTLIEWQLIEFP